MPDDTEEYRPLRFSSERWDWVMENSSDDDSDGEVEEKKQEEVNKLNKKQKKLLAKAGNILSRDLTVECTKVSPRGDNQIEVSDCMLTNAEIIALVGSNIKVFYDYGSLVLVL
jgi:hypothetical protein